MCLLTLAAICRQAPAPVSSSGLAPLCAAGVDVAVSVLAHLELRDLASLARCSRSLHSLVADLPESLWREAAQRAYLPGHPVLRSDSVRVFMHTQHRAHCALDSDGAPTAVHSVKPGSVSPDFTFVAAVVRTDTDSVLSVARVPTSEELHRWTLPATLPGEKYSLWTSGQWRLDSCMVALPLRRKENGVRSIMLVHTVTGRQVVVDLQPGNEGLAEMHSWSSAGLLLVSRSGPGH